MCMRACVYMCMLAPCVCACVCMLAVYVKCVCVQVSHVCAPAQYSYQAATNESN